MASKTTTRSCCRNGSKELIQERKSAILSPHEELRERLLETTIDVKENIPERLGASRTSGSGSDGSSSRKRRSTKQGPAAKRHSGEKNRNTSGEDSVDFASDYSDDRGSTSSESQTSRTRGQPLPVMPEEDEVFDRTEEEEETEEAEGLKQSEEDVENEEANEDYDEEEVEYDDEEEDERERIMMAIRRKRDSTDEEDERNQSLQNADFEYTKRHLNSSCQIPAPSLLSSAKCEGIGSPTKVWSLMVKRDDIPRATSCLLKKHPGMTVNMRQLLVDWLMEVCESEKLHRETFHLTMDYVDRYLEASEERSTQDTFQLVGVAALFIAAKYEEIYPPKCQEFSNLTDGAFTADHIREMEVILAKEIGWSLGPITSIHWLSTYLQLLGTEASHSEHCEEGNMYVPEMLRAEYVDMCKILDFCLFELESMKYSYRTLAAAVLFCNYEPRSAVEQATGFSYEQLLQVIRYVRPISTVFSRLRQDGGIMPDHHLVQADDNHNIQVHFKYTDIQPLILKERSEMRLKQAIAANSKRPILDN